MSIVYLATFPNEKTYVGFDKSDKFRRKYQHMSDARNNRYPNLAFHNAIRKYGEPVWSILAKGLSEQDALKLEATFIKNLRSRATENGYNISSGGGSGFLGGHHSDESKRKTSESVNKAFKDPEVRARHKVGVNTFEHKEN